MEDDEWEQIQPPWQLPASHSGGWDGGTPAVIADNYLLDDTSNIFPAINHEGLPPVPPQAYQDCENPAELHSVSSALSPNMASGDQREEIRGSDRKEWRLQELLSAGIIRVAYVVRGYARGRGSFWSSVCVAGVLVVSVLYGKVLGWRRRLRRRRENEDRLMGLLREKDQLIKQLLVQIGQLKEALLSSRKVSVIRVL
ncbi:uncharacterized protein LOC127797780 [Diospyros lotus]|uniref:uncharacterized protein LOC127797780 n=1 Tax=Diospyros lotus TaxID=55363 RepID=UPI00224DE188|nr:uncharacterized protein LOC127797780 [Diospyros lotus]